MDSILSEIATSFLLMASALFITPVAANLVCLADNAVPDPSLVTKVARCGPHETCGMEQYITAQGGLRHNLLCKDTTQCKSTVTSPTEIHICSACCDTELCNANLCGKTGLPSGLFCFHCDYAVKTPINCENIKRCSADEVCGVNQMVPSNEFEVKCRPKTSCTALIATTTVCSGCCSTPVCNDRCGRTNTACVDDSVCVGLKQNFHNTGRDICVDPTFKHFCNISCGLCPTTTTHMTSTTLMTTQSVTMTSATPITTQSILMTTQTTSVPTSSPCHPNPCVHGACASTGGSNYQCTCNSGYTGTNFSPCHSNPCVQGTCSTTGSTTYQCTCNSGYSGTNCDLVSPCHSNPCVHGTCSSTGSTTYHCTCNSGYSGTNCGTASSPCHPNPCVHGTCSTTGSSTYQCTCNSGYSGTTCATVDPCATRQCVHGTCSSTSGIPVCTCDPGYRGAFCDTDYDECLSSPCVHGACMDKVNDYLCTCSTGFTGKNCDQATSTPCSPNPCMHGSCALQSASGYSCSCNTGYTGVNCSSVTRPCASSPCQHGKCLDQGSSYSCQCNVGYLGSDCDTQIRDCKDVLDNHIPSPTNDVIYTVIIDNIVENVRCDMTTDGGGWTVLMNREGSAINFTKDSTEYALGFGNARSDFWIGLEDMHTLTSDGRRYQLRVELTRDDGSKYYEVYNDFSIGPRPTFVLHIGQATGNAGDSLRRHDGYGFTTVDSDHDSNKNTNCAVYLQGAWWFHDCYDSCLTCPYATPGEVQCRSMSWNELKYCEALKAARMLVRPM